MERIPKSDAEGGLRKAFCAIVCSMGRVTSCSTSCAVAPGQAVVLYAPGSGDGAREDAGGEGGAEVELGGEVVLGGGTAA